MRGDPRTIQTTNVLENALEGARLMYEAVSRAYGPTSFNVALQKSYGSHVITHDGVTIAKDCILRDQSLNIGADQLYKASLKTDQTAGDGTSVTVVLGYHIMQKAHQRIAAGYNPMALRRGITWAARQLVSQLDTLTIPVKDNSKMLEQIATISAADPELGKLVADTVVRAGSVGIGIEEYEGLGVLQDVIEGIYFEKGWSLPHFVNNSITEEALHDNMHIICFEKRIRANQDIVPILEMVFEQTEHKGLLIIGNLSDKALQTCALTNIKGGVRVCVVPPPVYGSQVLPFLEDVAVMTGGKVVPENMPANKVTSDFLGFAKKIIVARDATTIMKCQGDPEQIQMRVDTLNKQLKSDKYNAFEKERMEKRMSKLLGKIGIIRVGGATDGEREETKFRVTDAVNATRGAKEDGVVPGGGTTLARLGKDVLQNKRLIVELATLSRDEQEGAKVVFESLAEPFKQLMANAGEDPGFRLSQVERSKPAHGFNVTKLTDEPIDLLKAGVIDPVRVLKAAIENSCSVAGIVITLGASMTIDRDFQLEQVQLNRAGVGQG
jgi:chaperonin GroEL